ncbi:MAG TPA: hypothetical protein VK427_21470 [Kofleriaceae bacterium]|nr:hypothetical protein [Kofleriaceae bacterium]
MRAHLCVAFVLALVACKKDKAAAPAPEAPTSTAEQDALWALAPDRVVIGVVLAPSGVARLEGAALDIQKLVGTVPELATEKAKLDDALVGYLGTTHASLASVGMSKEKAAALFITEDGAAILVLPVADRDKFVKVVKGTRNGDLDTIKLDTCKIVKNVYACVRAPEHFERIGKGTLAGALGLAGARGDIEIAAALPDGPITFGVVAQLARGSAVVRGAIKGVPPQVRGFLANAPVRSNGDKTAAFAMVNVAPYLPLLQAQLPPMRVVEGVLLEDLMRTIAGPLTMTLDNGATMFDVRLPLTDGGVAQKLVSQCDQLPPLKLIGATVKDGVCHAAVPQMQLALDAWVDGKTLRFGHKAAPAATVSSTLPPVVQELARGNWVATMYGRGTLYVPTAVPIPLPAGELDTNTQLGLRIFAMINELGFGVRVDGELVRGVATIRTAWANPDDVVAKLVAIAPRDVIEGKAGAQAQAIASASPGSPFAADVKAGANGLMVPAAIIGVMSAVAIPVFLGYVNQSNNNNKAERGDADRLENGPAAPDSVPPAQPVD